MNKAFITAALIAAVAPSVANAKIKADKEAPIDTTKMVQLQDVQVVSTRANKKTPIAYTTVSKSQIKSVNHGKDLPSLLTMTPSVTMTSDAGNGIGYTTLMVRGSDNTRVNITANGIPLNDAESSGLYWVNMGDFASSAEDIQIQRGVGTSTNGAGAFGATVNIQTEKIGAKPFIGLDMSSGSYYSHKETLRFGTGLLGGHWGIQGRLSNIGSKGYIDRASTKLNSYFIQGGYFGDNTAVKFITFNGQEQTYHAWNYASQYERDAFGRTFNSCGAMSYTGSDGTIHYSPDFTYDVDGIASTIANGGGINYYKNQSDFYHQQHYQLILDQRLPANLALNVGLHYTRGDGYYEQYKAGTKLYKYGIGFSKTDLINQKKMANDFFGGVASLTYDNRNGLQAILGGAWNRYVGDHFGYITWVKDQSALSVSDLTPYYKYYDNRSRKNDGNLYGKVNYEFIKGLSAFIDLQYRHVSIVMHGPTDEFDKKTLVPTVFNELHQYDFFNPKFGLNYDINSNNKVYASVAVSHKEPTRNDFEENVGIGLKAEQLVDWEAGYKFQSEKFSAGLNLYYMNYTNQFVLTGQLNDIGEPIKANSGKSYRMGIELEAAWKPVDWFMWNANATFSKNRNKDWTVTLCDPDTYDYGETVSLGETPITFSPSTIFNNCFTFSYNGLKAAIQSRYVSKQYLTNTGFESYTDVYYTGNEISTLLDGHFTTDIDISYTTKALKKFGIKEAMLGVTLYNIFSTKYDTNGWNYCEVGVKDGKYYGWSDSPCETGLSAAAPFNFMVNLSLNF